MIDIRASQEAKKLYVDIRRCKNKEVVRDMVSRINDSILKRKNKNGK